MMLGLTGGYCAGKNTVAALLEERGWKCIDVDRLGHEAMALAKDAIVERFGQGVVAADGGLDRRALAAIVFSDPAALADQEAIVHPVANALTRERIEAAQAEARAAGAESQICVNAALLHRTGLVSDCDAIVEVKAPLWTRIARGARRDGAGWKSALRRITRQRGFRAELRAQAEAAGLRVLALWNCGSRASLERALARSLARLAEARLHGAAPRDARAGAAGTTKVE